MKTKLKFVLSILLELSNDVNMSEQGFSLMIEKTLHRTPFYSLLFPFGTDAWKEGVRGKSEKQIYPKVSIWP